ncbi:Hypothetical protein NTJ_05553 [Nesidiocoris tenuis]|uniref:Uncharacterized protein n=1 Tax=Nesidiocoris tenuis TaxID=355587 RepID=A0ABN7ANC1_9HEMI|nr:Hypothetical protein NTJ_05553 [Nesidiocoris tenuis]
MNGAKRRDVLRGATGVGSVELTLWKFPNGVGGFCWTPPPCGRTPSAPPYDYRRIPAAGDPALRPPTLPYDRL